MVAAAAFAATALAGCSASSITERLPADVGGEPADTPARPTAAYQYPAVHDMPPARPDEPLSDEAQVKLEKELESVRDRQEGRPAAAAKSGKKAAQTGKKPPPQTNQSDGAGGKGNP